MLIRCWGARGSIPVSGPEYIKYGGDTTCIEIRTKSDDLIIIDAGSGIRKLGKKLIAEGRKAFSLLFTHAHWDHLLGFPFFEPIYQPESRINIYGCNFMGDSIKATLSPTMKPPHFPVHYEDISADMTHLDACAASFVVGSVQVSTIALSHPNQGVGYKFLEDGKSMVFLTDNELLYPHDGAPAYEDFLAFCEGTHLLIHDAEFSRDLYEARVSWGHSCYEDALALARQAGVKMLGLFHHNQDSADERVDSYLAHCRQLINKSGAKLDCLALYQGWEMEI